MDILDLHLSNPGDSQPLQLVSGEQLAKWQAIERAGRRLIYNYPLNASLLHQLLRDLELALITPTQEEQPDSQQE